MGTDNGVRADVIITDVAHGHKALREALGAKDVGAGVDVLATGYDEGDVRHPARCW